MLMSCENLLWVTPDSSELPLASICLGLLRTIRSERDSDGSNIVTLTVSDCQHVPPEDVAVWTCGIVKHQFTNNERDDRHAEYLLRDDIIHIGRLRTFDAANNFLALQSEAPPPDLLRINDIQRPVCLEKFAPGIDPRWITDLQHFNPLPETQILVEIRAIGVTSSFDSLNIPIEAAGIVTKVGPAVKGLTTGDKVVLLVSSTGDKSFQTFARIEEAVAIKIADNIPLETAASLPAAFVTAIYGLGHVAKLSSSDTILIHAGADVYGQAGIQYAKLIGANIFATVSTAESRAFLTDVYGIPEANLFSNKSLDFSKSLMRRTNGAGVDVIFNTLTGEVQQESFSCIKEFGRFIDVSGNTSHLHLTQAPASVLRTLSISNIDLEILISHRPSIVRQLIEEIFCLYSEGKLRQVQPLNILPLSQIKRGIQTLQSEEAAEKIVFVPGPDDLIPIVPEQLSRFQFDGKASYILAGGLGGLGRSTALWMAAQGAKSLIFLSRSNKYSEAVKIMVSELERLGCDAHIFACDLVDRCRLRTVLDDCHRILPPIKGCIQCSMVLKVCQALQ
jgi:NADPH:quinone reductase-like Zn-dependent oxidoreductase